MRAPIGIAAPPAVPAARALAWRPDRCPARCAAGAGRVLEPGLWLQHLRSPGDSRRTVPRPLQERGAGEFPPDTARCWGGEARMRTLLGVTFEGPRLKTAEVDAT